MRKFLALLKISLNVNFGISAAKHRLFKEKKDRWIVAVMILAVVSLAPMVAAFLRGIKMVYQSLEPIGQEHAVLTLGILGGQIFILVFGLYYIISVFYFSRDLEILIPLPLKPYQIMASKFGVVLINEYLTSLIIVAPIFIYYGILSGASIIYWLSALIVYLLIPIIPMTISAIIVIVMMRFVNLSKKKDFLMVVGSMALLIFILGIQFAIGNMATTMDQNSFIEIMTGEDGIVNLVGTRFPPSIWATKAMAFGLTSKGIYNFALFAGVSMAIFILLLVVGEKLFYQGLIGGKESIAKKKILSKQEMDKRMSQNSSPVNAIFMRELRVMNRTPIFLLNGVLPAVLIPLIFIFPMFMGGNETQNMITALNESANPLYIGLGALIFALFCSSTNGVSSTTFSREGRNFWMSKVIPVPYGMQIKAKLLHSYFLSSLGIVTAIAVSVYLLRLDILTTIMIFILALIGNFLLTSINMMVDLSRPLLDWTNPQKAIKQNFNVLIAMLVDSGIMVIIWMVSMLLSTFGLNNYVIYLILMGALLALSLVLYKKLQSYGENRYIEIEE